MARARALLSRALLLLVRGPGRVARGLRPRGEAEARHERAERPPRRARVRRGGGVQRLLAPLDECLAARAASSASRSCPSSPRRAGTPPGARGAAAETVRAGARARREGARTPSPRDARAPWSDRAGPPPPPSRRPPRRASARRRRAPRPRAPPRPPAPLPPLLRLARGGDVSRVGPRRGARGVVHKYARRRLAGHDGALVPPRRQRRPRRRGSAPGRGGGGGVAVDAVGGAPSSAGASPPPRCAARPRRAAPVARVAPTASSSPRGRRSTCAHRACSGAPSRGAALPRRTLRRGPSCSRPLVVEALFARLENPREERAALDQPRRAPRGHAVGVVVRAAAARAASVDVVDAETPHDHRELSRRELQPPALPRGGGERGTVRRRALRPSLAPPPPLPPPPAQARRPARTGTGDSPAERG